MAWERCPAPPFLPVKCCFSSRGSRENKNSEAVPGTLEWELSVLRSWLNENCSLCKLSGSMHRGGPQAQTPSSCLVSPQIKTYELLWCDLMTKANRNFISSEVACHFLLPPFFCPINTLIVRNTPLSVACIWGGAECVFLGRGPGYGSTVTLLAICLIAWFSPLPSPPPHTHCYLSF